MAKAFIDFDALKKQVPIEDVVEWLGFPLKTMANGQLRGCCPICESRNDRSFVVTPAKGLYNCFNGCGGGDIIRLVANFSKIGTREAAAQLQSHFCDKEGTVNGNSEQSQSTVTVTVPAQAAGPKTSSLPDLSKVAARLKTDHSIIPALGLTPEVCQALGWGYDAAGTMRGRFLVALRRDDGQLIGFLGIATKEEMIPLLQFPPNLAQLLKQEEPKDEPATGTFGFLRVVK
jgi:hypothetical protein